MEVYHREAEEWNVAACCRAHFDADEPYTLQ
jgi:hypothetical protein